MNNKIEILVAEDSLTQAEQLKYLLESYNYYVTVATNGKDALEKARKNKPTLIISDIMMPLMDGFELCAAIKNIPDLSNTPFILLTSLSDPEDIMRGLECGADNFVLKPYDEKYLLVRIKNLLTNFELRQSEKIQMAMEVFFGGKYYTINSDKRQILDLLISTFESAVQQNRELINSQLELRILNEQLEERINERTANLLKEISERKKAEEDLKSYHEELEKRVLERTAELSRTNELLKKEIEERKKTEIVLAKRTEEVSRVNEELKQFAYVASHDLQEPLRMISSYTKLLEKRYKDKLDDNANDYIHYAVDGAIRMQKLIDELLYYSRIGTNKVKYKPVNIADVIQEVTSNLQLLIEENQAVINFDNMPVVYSDVTQINQLFQNLISNSVKYKNQEPPLVEIGAVRQDNEWLFSVKDNGIGIRKEDQERIFVIFQRLHSKTEYPGSGMGLAICKKIIENHHGRIWLESEVGKGTIFYFTLAAEPA